jgi:N-acylglucosamine-6-phosphate 2-epimerase
MNEKFVDCLERLRHVVIVSAQAADDEPLNKPEHLLALALSGINGGALGLRLEGSANVRFIRKHTRLPIIGLVKNESVPESERLSSVYITSTFAEAKEISDAGSDIIALDATPRPRPDGLSLAETIKRIHEELGKPVWADVSTFEEGMAARAAGADVVSSTLYGYTAETKRASEDPPDFDLLSRLCKELDCPVVLEGRVWHPEEVTKAFELGTFAVVVGSAITRPQLITKRFVKAVPVKA